MFWAFDLVIPAATPATLPVELDVDLVPGLLHRVEIQFPTGCRGHVHVQVYQEGHQLFPTNPDADFTTDGYTIAWNESHELVEGQAQLTLRGWSPQAAFPHTITFRFGVLEAARPVPPVFPPLEPVPVLGILEIP